MPECKECGFSGPPESFEPAMSAYHDFQCPKCKTTHISTQDVAGVGYGYGEHNTLDMSNAARKCSKENANDGHFQETTGSS